MAISKWFKILDEIIQFAEVGCGFFAVVIYTRSKIFLYNYLSDYKNNYPFPHLAHELRN